MHLLVGLGNPGPRHALNRHNIGFRALDAVARRHGFGPWRSKFTAEIAEGTVGGRRVLALKPMTFMNRSGQAVGAAARFHKIPLERIIVIHDELDLAPGRVRVKTGGGHGGNNGVRDVIAHMGAEFVRVRLGIGHPGDRALVTGHVLSDPGKAEREIADRLVEAVADELPLLLDGDAGAFMSRVSHTMSPLVRPPAGDAKPKPPDGT